jgi:hypothetical protein
MNAYQQKAMKVGRPRLSPEEVQAMVGKGDGDAVARGMLAFVKAGDVLYLRPAPYFAPSPEAAAAVTRARPMFGAGSRFDLWQYPPVPHFALAFAAVGIVIGVVRSKMGLDIGDEPVAAVFSFALLGAMVGAVWRGVSKLRERNKP